jgi:starch synthase
VALLGSGEKRYEDFFRYIARKFPRRAFITIGYDNPLSHSIIAASDFLALPSLFEPCGLTQMYALKYGTVPIVRATGGLADTVEEYDAVTMRGTGFLFDRFNRREFYNAVQRALISYRFQPHWDKIRQNGMAKNFSSEVSAGEYINVFTWALEKIGVTGVE